jgi:4-amino-4-deoxy-L-arabinose transferase-like glycosyltransferase
MVFGLCFLIGFIWFCAFMLARTAPEWDNMEELVWANSFELGYQKHPPLPTWLLYPLTYVFGKQMWLPVMLGVLCVAICQWIMYHLYIRIANNSGVHQSHEFALLAILTSSFLIYFTIRGGDYNHNAMQLWSIAAMYYAYYRSWEQERDNDNPQHYWWWVLLGIMTGLALISKYSVLIQIVLLISHYIFSSRWKIARSWLGLGIAVVFCLIISTPHFLWLYQQTLLGQGPIYYVSQAMQVPATMFDRVLQLTIGFLLTQIYRIVPCILFVSYIVWQYRSLKYQTQKTFEGTMWSQIQKNDQRFLLFLLMGPTLVALLIGIVFNQNIEAKWAVTFYIGIGFIAWKFAKDDLNINQITKKAILGQVLFALFFALLSGQGASYIGKQGRGNFPSADFAKVIQQRWNEHPELTNGAPIRLVIGDTWIIGNIIIHDPISQGRDIKPWIDANDLMSPWMTEKDKQHVALILIDHVPKVDGQWWRAGHPPTPQVREMFDRAPVKGIEIIPWTQNKDAPPLEIQWAILPYKP